jgi:serine protease Do
MVSGDGLVLTVLSLLIDARRVRAVTSDGRLYEADVVHRDSKRQLALLSLRAMPGEEPPSGRRGSVETPTRSAGRRSPALPFFDLSIEATLRPGDWVLAAGNPFKVAEGAEPVSVLHGVFSARTRLDARRRLRDFPYRGDVLVIDAITSNPGAPGSALVNLDGQFVGMIGREVISNLTHTHFNYAVPRDVLHAYFLEATAIRDGEFKAADWESARKVDQTAFDHGIRLSRVGYRKVLPFVERVRSGSPADKAGVRRDDLILSVNGRQVPDAASFDARLEALAPQEPIHLVIRRGRAIVSVRIDKNLPVDLREDRGTKTPKER